MMNYILSISIAGITCSLDFIDKNMFDFFNKEFSATKIDKKPGFTIFLRTTTKQRFIYKKYNTTEGLFLYPKISNLFKIAHYRLRIFIEYFTLEKNVIFIHASSFIKNGCAHIFCGPSGSGKSTIVRDIPDKYVLSYDTTVIKKEGRNFWAYTSPFDNIEKQNLIQQKALIKNIFFLKQDTENKMIPLDMQKALQYLIPSTIVFQYVLEVLETHQKGKSLPADVARITDRLKNRKIFLLLFRLDTALLSGINTYLLYFTRNLCFRNNIV